MLMDRIVRCAICTVAPDNNKCLAIAHRSAANKQMSGANATRTYKLKTRVLYNAAT